MVVKAYARIKGKKLQEGLAKVAICSYLVHCLVGGDFVGLVVKKSVPRLTAKVEIVCANGDIVASKERKSLVCRRTHHLVVGVEAVVEGLLLGRVTVVYPVSPFVEKEIYRTRCALIAIL